MAEEVLRGKGPKTICLACESTSPFAPYLQARGYNVLGTAQMCLKALEGRPFGKGK
jgi:hypothetical protein